MWPAGRQRRHHELFDWDEIKTTRRRPGATATKASTAGDGTTAAHHRGQGREARQGGTNGSRDRAACHIRKMRAC